MPEIIEKLNMLLWGRFTIIAILACGVFHTVRWGFIQLKLPVLLKSGKGKNKLKAVSSALAASMGTGNITGCAAAIAAGGPGAVFWMWISAAGGMALAYAENRIGAEYALRYPNSVKGPMLYIEKGAGSKKAAEIYAAGCLAAVLCMGCMSQSGAFAAALSSQTSLPGGVCSLLAAALTAAVIFSSKKTSDAVMNAAAKIVPLMSLLYGAGCIALLTAQKSDIPSMTAEIISCAFAPRAAVGGLAGITVKKTVSVGLRRGIFSNEAGMGSSVMAHSEADFGSPENTGAWAAFEVFLDTMVCCTLTAFTVMTLKGSAPQGDTMTFVFENAFGAQGGIFICLCICLFAWAAVLGQSSYGEKCLTYLKGSAGNGYKAVICLFTAIGGIMATETVFGISDLINVLIMFPNLAAVTAIAASEDIRKGSAGAKHEIGISGKRQCRSKKILTFRRSR